MKSNRKNSRRKINSGLNTRLMFLSATLCSVRPKQMRKIYEVKKYNQKRILNFITSGNVAFDYAAHRSGAGERLFLPLPASTTARFR